jgi:hypothetical protein
LKRAQDALEDDDAGSRGRSFPQDSRTVPFCLPRGASAPYEIDDSVACMRQVLANVDRSQSGCFIDRNGVLIPWILEENLNK